MWFILCGSIVLVGIVVLDYTVQYLADFVTKFDDDWDLDSEEFYKSKYDIEV